MQKIKIFLLFISVYTSYYSQLKEQGEQHFNLQSVISKTNPNFGVEYRSNILAKGTKRVAEIRYFIDKKGEIDYSRVDSSFTELNEKGKVVLIGSGCNKHYFRYDSLGRMIVDSLSNCTMDFEYKETYKYYNDSIIESIEGDFPTKFVYTLDKFGNKIKREDYDGERISTYWTKTYNQNNNVVDFKFFWGDKDSLEFHERYEYGKENELILCEVIKFPYDNTDVYDFSGDLMVAYYDAITIKYRYDYKNNTLTELRTYKSGYFLQIQYSYDKYGNLISVDEERDAEKYNTHYFLYKYDKKGNVIEEKKGSSGKLRSITKYTYEYYE